MSISTQKLPFKEKLAYGFGDLASVLYWQTFMLYFTFFYTDVFLIPASAAATMFLVSRIWDGVNDPLMGIVADRTQTRWGKFRPYLLWICVPFAVAGVLTFTVPNFGPTGKLVWAYSTFILIMMLYTAINIPYTALLGVISADSKERTTVSSVKFIFAFAAGIIVSATLLPMVKSFGGGDATIITSKVNNETIIINEVGKGNARVMVSAEDPQGHSDKLEFRFRVIAQNNNFPVIVHPQSDIRLESGFHEYRTDISKIFRSNNGSPLLYTIANEDTNTVQVKIQNDSLIVQEAGIGYAKITLTAADKSWGSRTNSFYINVNAKENMCPVISDSADFIELKSGFKNQIVDLSRIFKDPDGDTLTFKVSSSNQKVISPELSGHMMTFLEMAPGISDVTIHATDGRGGRISHSIQYLISTPRDNPPYAVGSVENIIKSIGFGEYELNASQLFYDSDGEPLQYKVNIINEAKGWQASFILYGLAAVFFFLITFRGTRERVQPPKTQKSSIKKDLYELITNAPWLILLATTITFILFVAVRSSVTAHYFKYVIGSQEIALPFMAAKTYSFETLVSAFNTIGQIASLLGVLFVSWFAKKVGKKRAFILIFLIAILSTTAFYFLTAKQIALIFLFQFTGSLTGGPLSVLLWAMYADTADYAEWKYKRRATGLVFSASTMSQKFGWAFGAFVALKLMSQVGFAANQIQSTTSLKGLILLFSLIPAGMGVFSIIISLFYPLNESKVKDIGLELGKRRQAF